MPSLKEWITEDGERVLYELTNLLKYLGVELGNMKSLRRTVDANFERLAEKVKATKRPVVDSLKLYEEIEEAIIEQGTTYSIEDFNILQSATTGQIVIQHIKGEVTLEVEFTDELAAINFFIGLYEQNIKVITNS